MSDKTFHILLVDDSPEDRDMYRLQLCRDEECVYTFVEAEMASEGLELATAERFDCILLDYRLTDQDGLQFLQGLKEVCGKDHAPVVMITGQGSEKVAVQALRLGASDYLVKAHITPESIHRATQNAIEKWRQERALAFETARAKELQEQLRLLVEGARDHALILLDATGSIATWNSAAVQLTGYMESEAIGRHIGMLFVPEDVSVEAPMQELLRAERFGKIDVERWLRKKNNQHFWATGSVSVLRNEQGAVRGFAQVIRDDTMRKRLLDEQANQHKWLENLLNMLPVAFLLIENSSGRVLFANAAAGTLSGSTFPHSESFQEYEVNYPVLAPEGMNCVVDEHPWITVATGKGNSLEMIWQTASGDKHLWVTSRALPPLFGRDPAVILCLQDITRLKETEGALMKANVAAANAARAKNDFFANMSHEIRTPLHAILGFSEMLSDDGMPTAQRARYAGIIERNGRVLVHLIDSILDLSKIEAGQLEITPEPALLHEAVMDVLEMFEQEAASKDIFLETSYGADLPSTVMVDAIRLKQILFNMFSNALKFTHKGKVSLAVTLDSSAHHPDGILVFKIKDTGIGISPLQQENLFQPFSQGDSSITRRYGGTGLGLALCTRLAELMGGKFELIHSEVETGSEFALYLPLRVEDAVMTDTPQLGEVAEGSMPIACDLKGKHILLVEDTEDNQQLVLHALRETGAHIRIAHNGREALDEVREHHFDLILMDVQMPLLDGKTATQLLRREEFKNPIIGVSANAFNDDRIKSLEAGMDDYLTKPITPRKLINKLKSWMAG